MMDRNDILYDLAKELVSSVDLESIIRKEIKEKLLDYSFECAILNVATDIVREKGENYIREQIDAVVNGTVRLDDGWGNVEDVGTFEDYVRKSLRKQCFEQWKLEQKLRNAVDERLNTIARKVVDRHLKEDIVGEVLAELVKDTE